MNIVAVREKPQVTQSQIIQFRQQESPEQNDSQTVQQIVPVPAVIKVVSAGGGGLNALNRMIDAKLEGVEFIAINTDAQDLYVKSKSEVNLRIGSKITGGRGAGGNPEKGEQAALEDVDAISETLHGADMIFITAGMGGGTGTGSAPVIARISREQGSLTVAVVTTPFEFEGRYRMRTAEMGIAKLREQVDTLIVIPNQHLFKMVNTTTAMDSAFLLADEVLCRGVQGISELITKAGFQNTDFADVEAIMKGKGDALMGIGLGTGENRAAEAVKNAIDNPLLEDTSIDGATGVLINITGPQNITLIEINNMIKTIKDKCDPEVNLIYGLRYAPEMENTIQITVIATGFKGGKLEINQPVENKSKDPIFLDVRKFEKLKERTTRPDFLSCLPPKDFQDDLDISPLIRNYDYRTGDAPEAEKAGNTQIG